MVERELVGHDARALVRLNSSVVPATESAWRRLCACPSIMKYRDPSEVDLPDHHKCGPGVGTMLEEAVHTDPTGGWTQALRSSGIEWFGCHRRDTSDDRPYMERPGSLRRRPVQMNAYCVSVNFEDVAG